MATFENLRINQLSPAGTAWFAELLRVIETLDAGAVIEMMSKDITASHDSGVSLEQGRDQIRSTLEAGWAQTTSLLHDELNLYGTDDHFVHEARTTVGFSDGRMLVIPALVAIDRDEDGLLASWRVYKDSAAGTL